MDGVVGSIRPDYPALGTSAGEAAVRVLKGESPASVPFGKPTNVELQLNGTTIKELGLQIPADVLASATVL